MENIITILAFGFATGFAILIFKIQIQPLISQCIKSFEKVQQHIEPNPLVINDTIQIYHQYDQKYNPYVPLIDYSNRIIGKCELQKSPAGTEVYVTIFNTLKVNETQIRELSKLSKYSLICTVNQYNTNGSAGTIDIKAVQQIPLTKSQSNIVVL